MMGAGKTSVGKRLAAKLGLPFVDADAEIEAGAQLTIPEIFERFGEAYFREGERKVIARLLNGGPQVLATGGGAFMNRTTRDNIAARGVSIWLKPDVEVLLARVRKKSNRPLLQTDDPEETLRRLLEERSPTYALADITIESRDGPHEFGGRDDAAPPRRAAVRRAGARAADRRKVEVPLGARAYSILIGPGVIDEAGAEIARIAPGGQVRDRHRRECRAALSRPADRKPRRGRAYGSTSIVCPPGEATKSYAEFARVSRRADRGAHRTARHRHRARRRGHRRSDRLLRRLASPRRALRPDSRRRCCRRSIPASAARPASIRRTARTWSARSTSPRSCSPIPAASTR